MNYLLGRGKSVLAEARLPGRVVSRVFHTEPIRMAQLARVKHWTGSAMAGVPGMAGCNAHAANLVAALFAATGQDLAQVLFEAMKKGGQYHLARYTLSVDIFVVERWVILHLF